MGNRGLFGLAVILALTGAWSADAQAGNRLTVTSNGDGLSGPGCTLRMAVAAANTGASNACGQGTGSNDTVQLGGPGATAITLNPSLGPIQITSSMVIQGNFQGVAQDYTTVTVSTTGSSLLQIPSSASNLLVTLQWLRLTGAQGSNNGGCIAVNGGSGIDLNEVDLNTVQIDHCSGNKGGAIYASGNVGMVSSFLHDNHASLGGAVAVDGTNGFDPSITANSSTFSSNSAASGGGVYNYNGHSQFDGTTFDSNSSTGSGGGLYVTAQPALGSLLMTNDTFANNTAATSGGAVYFDDHSYWEVSFVTIAHNSAGTSGGGIYLNAGAGGTISDGNNIFAYNSANQGPDVSGNCQFFAGLGRDIVTNASGNTPPQGGSYNPWFVTDPELGTLQSINGLPKVYPLVLGSPAIDAAGSQTTSYDERGDCRPLAGYGQALPDIGAFEFDPQSTYTIVSVNSGMALDDPGFSTTAGTQMQQWTVNNGQNQQWQVGLLSTQRIGSAVVNLLNQTSFLTLGVRGSSTSNGAAVEQETWGALSSQQWTFAPAGTGTGYFTFKNVHSGQMMDVAGASKSAGALIDQWPSNGGANQKWTLTVNPSTFCSSFPYLPF